MNTTDSCLFYRNCPVTNTRVVEKAVFPRNVDLCDDYWFVCEVSFPNFSDLAEPRPRKASDRGCVLRATSWRLPLGLKNTQHSVYGNNLTKYHPAGYSSGYSTSRKFASRIFGWNILLLIQKKITHSDQNDSYSTQCHTKGFQNIKLVSHYSKSVSRKNSKCLDFVLVQVTGIVQKRNNLSSCYTESKNDSYSTQWHTKGFQNIRLVSQYSKSVSCKNSKCLDFVLVQVTHIVQKWHNLSFMLHKIKKWLLFNTMA